MTSIAIIGMGYVGLPLSLAFAQNGLPVIGIDIDPKKVDSLNAGTSYIAHIGSDLLRTLVDQEKFRATSDFSSIQQVDAVVLCLPTPLNAYREPDLSYVLESATKIAPHIRPGVLVVLESTTYPGTTDTELRSALESVSGLTAGVDFHLAFSPEREDPGNPDSKVAAIPKIVGGLTPACRDKAIELYSHCIKTLVPVSSCRVAEATKLLENIFRSVNIALVNELKLVYGAMDIDIWEVIEAAKTKPFGYMPFYPGPGLGGHCIPIDPFYLTWKAREYGMHTRFIELAGEINTAMPDHVVRVAFEALNAEGKSVKGSRILILGLAYKANVDDDRESPTYKLIEKFEAFGAEVVYHDPHVPVIPKTREHAAYAGRRSVAEITDSYDLIVLSTGHDVYKNFDFTSFDIPLIDTRNCINFRPEKYRKA